MTRIGASQAFFNIAAQFNANKFLSDARSLATVMKSVQLDTFEAILKPMEDFGAAIETAIDSTKELSIELGQAQVEFEKFYGSGADMQMMANDITNIGIAYKNSATEALAAGSRAAQVANIVGKHNVSLLVKQANILSEISDLTVEEAQRGIIKLQQQTGILYGDYTQAQIQAMNVQQQNTIMTQNAAAALDSLNTIANRSVALEGDLVQTMTNFAAQANLAGDSFHFMAASSAVLLEAGEEAGTAGRALRMVYARLGGNINGTTDAIQAMGYSLYDENDELKNMQDILAELNTDWGGLSKAKQQEIAQTIAGNRHYVRFIKLMENYDRATTLAAEGAEGLDSAVDQANRALEDQSSQLMVLNEQLDLYRAAIGQDMGSFMIGQLEMQKDYLEVVSVVMKDMGAFGKALGRLYETAKVTGEFIKMGIAIRSMSIGFGIYESVMRGTHGIEIANQALHSKQANYFNYRQTMTENHKTLMKGIMFTTQKINTATERAGLIKKEMNALEILRNKNLEKIAEKENFITAIEEDQLHIRKQIGATQRLQEAQTQYAGNTMERRIHQMQYMKDIGRDIQQEWQDHIKGRTASEDAYARQLMTAFEVHQDLSGESRQLIRNKHAQVRLEHTAFQQLKEYNDMARNLRDRQTDIGYASMRRLHKDSQMVEVINTQLEKQHDLKSNALKTEEQIAEMSQFQQQMARDRNKELQYEIDGIEQIQEVMAKGDKMKVGGKDGIKQEGAAFINKFLTETQSQFIALEKSVNLFNKQLFDSGGLQHRLNELQEVSDMITNDQVTGLEEKKISLEKLHYKESQYMKEVQPLLEEYEAAVKAGADASKQKQALIEALGGSMEDVKGLIQQFSTAEQKMTMTQQQAAQQTKRMTFAGANAISMLGGLVGETDGAVLSLSAMTLQLGSVAGEAVNAGIEMFRLNQEMLSAARVAAKETGESFSALAFNIKAYGKVAALAAASVAMMLYFRKMQKEAQEAQDRIRGVQEATENLNAVFDGLTASGTIFGDDEGLAELLGLDNVSMGEFSNNTDLITSYLDTILEAELQVTGARNEQLQTTKDQLELMQQMYEGAGVKSVSKFSDAIDELGNAMDEAGHLGKGGFFDGFSKYERKKVLGIMEELGMSMDDIRLKFFEGAFASEHDKLLAIEAGDQMAQFKKVIADEGDVVRQMGSRQQKLVVMELVELMKTGTKISEDIMSDLAKSFEGEDAMGVIAILESMNEMVLTEADVEAGIKDLERAFDELNDTAETTETDLANLTDELYNFANAREELFFGGKYGNVTGSLYKQVVTQGVGTLYHKNEIIVSNVFHGFFNEQEAAFKISSIVENILDGRTA